MFIGELLVVLSHWRF